MESDPQKTCANCGIALRGTGPRSAVLAERFCMSPECQRIKQRRYRSQVRYDAPEPPIDDRPCFRCGAAMGPRTPRITDSPVGRWCPKAPCQRDRGSRLLLAATVAAMKAGDPVTMTMTEMALLSARLMRERSELGRVHCHACGRPDAIRDYPHPTPDRSEICRALGNHASLRADNDFFFPDTIV